MGGKALTKPSTRLSKSEYDALLPIVLSKLTDYQVKPSLSYFDKQDFGDLDLLFSSTNFNPFTVAKLLNATEVIRNNDVTSIGYKVNDSIFQIDLIKVSPKSFDFAYHYFAFNDLGNFIGRIAHKFGFKFGHNGLVYQLFDPVRPTHLITEFLVTTSFKEALTFLEFSYEKYEQGKTGGFKTLTDIFNFVIDNPFFNRDIFLLENRNAKARMRDTKRQSYMSFLKYIGNHTDGFDYSSVPNLKNQKLVEAFNLFPEFKIQYDEQLQQYAIQQQIKEKFNGKIVMDVTGMLGKELQGFITSFKNNVPNFNEYVLNTAPEVIIDDLLKFKNRYNEDFNF